MTHSWYVLMEEHTAESKRIETHTVLELHQVEADLSRHVEGDRQEAEQMAWPFTTYRQGCKDPAVPRTARAEQSSNSTTAATKANTASASP